MPIVRTALPLLVATLLLASIAARADTIGAIESPSGVAVQASLEGGNRLVIALLPQRDILLNGRLGVSFDAGADDPAWSGDLPRLVLGSGDYFTEPVLETVHFDPATLAAPVTLAVSFGACLPVTGICVLEEALLTLTPDGAGSLDLTMATVEP